MEGQAVAKRIGAKYAEVSAMTGSGVEEVFDLAMREALRGRGGMKTGANSVANARTGKRRAKCNIL